MENELKLVFENTEVEIFTINNQPMFEIYSTGMALGQVKKNSKGMLYPRKERIDENVKSADITLSVHNGHKLINETQLYDLMLEMKTDKVKPFRKWIVNEVIPQIRITGGYIPIQPDDTREVIMAKALKLADRTIQDKDTIISLLQPKATAYDDLIDSKGFMTMKEVGDMIETGRNTLFALLRNKKIMSKQTGYNIPLNKYIKNKCFKVVVSTDEKGHSSSVSLVSPKGLLYIYNLIKKNKQLNEFNTIPLLEVSTNAN